jgi:hypothetical protein
MPDRLGMMHLIRIEPPAFDSVYLVKRLSKRFLFCLSFRTLKFMENTELHRLLPEFALSSTSAAAVISIAESSLTPPIRTFLRQGERT